MTNADHKSDARKSDARTQISICQSKVRRERCNFLAVEFTERCLWFRLQSDDAHEPGTCVELSLHQDQCNQPAEDKVLLFVH